MKGLRNIVAFVDEWDYSFLCTKTDNQLTVLADDLNTLTAVAELFIDHC